MGGEDHRNGAEDHAEISSGQGGSQAAEKVCCIALIISVKGNEDDYD